MIFLVDSVLGLTAPLSAHPGLVVREAQNTHRGQRIVWLDVARALGIALVVYGHVARGLMSAGILTDLAWIQIDFAIYTFHKPLFFYLSGMNVRRSRDQSGFFSSRAKAIILPYIVFSLLQGAVQVVMAGQTNGDLAPIHLLMIVATRSRPSGFSMCCWSMLHWCRSSDRAGR
tara:strand:+ start:491 stop:1009 length:519 start_codon:yes stop_codon:yes gene_type:complete